MQTDIIAAIATGLAESGIGIVRVSGAGSIPLVDSLFRPLKSRSLAETTPYRMRLGKVEDEGQTVDEALVVVMKAPHSYTGEDVVEIQCHGGVVVMQHILDLVLRRGARLAEPGEFTKRAFLNGRLDLTQAEAVIDVVRSKTSTGLSVAVDQLEGSLSRRIRCVRDELHSLLVRIEASIDFPEDDIPEVELVEMEAVIANTLLKLRALLATADEGRIYREGIKTVITGKPNVGKSSLLNRLLNENRALVTEVPGTTRDVIEETLNLKGIPLRLLDTAGIRETEDLVEQLGVRRAKELVQEADFVIHVLDVSDPLSSEDFMILDMVKCRKAIVVINKTDLTARWRASELQLSASIPVVEISLLHDSLEKLIEEIVDVVMDRSVSQQHSALLTRTRHKQAVEKSLEDLEQARATLDEGLPVDLISIGIQGALENLGEIVGETIRDTVIDEIFSQFCIGK